MCREPFLHTKVFHLAFYKQGINYLASLCVKASNKRVDHIRCARPVQQWK